MRFAKRAILLLVFIRRSPGLEFQAREADGRQIETQPVGVSELLDGWLGSSAAPGIFALARLGLAFHACTITYVPDMSISCLRRIGSSEIQT